MLRNIKELEELYPEKRILKNTNNEGELIEIICEVEPSSKHPHYSMSVSVINKTMLHYHNIATEIYTVLRGDLKLFLDGEVIKLKSGDSFVIKPNVKHQAEGNETWIEIRSTPGWKLEDHILVDRVS